MATETIPEGRGKAEAMRTFLARGGGLRKDGTYKRGPMRGKTVQQAQSMFENKWATVAPAIKDKYARRANDVLAPSEANPPKPPVTNASLNAARPGETTGQAAERFRASRTGKPAPSATPPPVAAPGNTFADLTKPVPPPAGGVNSIGNGEFANGKPMNFVDTKPVDTVNKLAGKTRAEQAATLMDDAKDNPPTAAQKVTQSPAPPSPNEKPGFGKGSFGYSFKDDMKTIGSGIAATAQRVVTPRDAPNATRPTAPPALSPADMKREDEARVAAMPARPPIPAPMAANASPAATAAPKPAAQSDGTTPPPVAGPRYGSRGRTSEGGQAPAITTPAAPTGKPVMGDAPKGVNRLTGLPMGYQPGDDVSKTDRQTQQRAADSVARQAEATRNAVPPVAPPKAIVAPATDRYADAQDRYQAGKAPAAEMDKVYAGSSEMDRARITAQSLKRASALNRTQTPPPVRRPVLAR